MTTLEIILLAWVAALTIWVAVISKRGGSHLNELEDELPPECDCRGFVKKSGTNV